MRYHRRSYRSGRFKYMLRCACCIADIYNKPYNHCTECKQQYCLNCSTKYFCILCKPTPLSLPLCYLCINFTLTGGWCSRCDNLVCGGCTVPKYSGERNGKLCRMCDMTGQYRDMLPNLKAKKIIIRYFIDDIAQIIFDYYYKQRRYTLVDIRTYGC